MLTTVAALAVAASTLSVSAAPKPTPQPEPAPKLRAISITVTSACNNECHVIYLNGDIGPADAKRFREEIEKYKIQRAVVILNSGGGAAMDGLAKEVAREYAYECAVTKSVPAPNDPSYKITITLDKDGIHKVVHTTASGKTYVRNQQYSDAKTGALRENEDWNTSPLIWIGTFNKSSDITMTGKIGTIDNGKKLVYLEGLYKTIKGKKVIQAFIESTCHEVQA